MLTHHRFSIPTKFQLWPNPHQLQELQLGLFEKIDPQILKSITGKGHRNFQVSLIAQIYPLGLKPWSLTTLPPNTWTKLWFYKQIRRRECADNLQIVIYSYSAISFKEFFPRDVLNKSKNCCINKSMFSEAISTLVRNCKHINL